MSAARWTTGPAPSWAAAATTARRTSPAQIQPPWLPNYDLFIVMDGKNLANLRKMAAGNGHGPGDARLASGST